MSLKDATQIASIVSAFIACVAAIVAAISATFAGVQMMLARKNSTLQSLQSFDKTVTDREAALASADSEEKKQHAFIAYLNFLELYAAVCNRKLLTGVAFELVRDRLIDSVVVIERVPQRHQSIEAAVFHSDTFAQLQVFLKQHDGLVKDRRNVAATRAQLQHGE